MSSEDVDVATADDATIASSVEPGEISGEAADEPAGPNWWHRDHPVFTPLSGFFAGMAFVILVPSLYAGLLSLIVDDTEVTSLFPFVLLALVVLIGLLVRRSTRRFGRYMTLGIGSTAVVVLGVAALVLWYLINH